MASQRSGSSSPSSGDHYNSEKAGASCSSPRTWHMDGNFGLRAEDAAPRSFAPSDSGRPIRVRPRREVRLAGLALCPLRCNPPQRSDPSLINQTCSLRAKPACCDFASLVLRISQHRSASSKREPRSPSQHFFWYIRPAWHYAPRQAYWNEDGIFSDHSSPKCCFAEDPRSSC